MNACSITRLYRAAEQKEKKKRSCRESPFDSVYFNLHILNKTILESYTIAQ